MGIAVNSLFGSGSGGSQSDIKIVFEFFSTPSILEFDSSHTSGEGVWFSESDSSIRGFVGIGSSCSHSFTDPVTFRNDNMSSSAPEFSAEVD